MSTIDKKEGYDINLSTHSRDFVMGEPANQ